MKDQRKCLFYIEESLLGLAKDNAFVMGLSLSEWLRESIKNNLKIKKEMTKRELAIQRIIQRARLIKPTQKAFDGLKDIRKMHNTAKFRAVNIWKQTKPRIFELRGDEKITPHEIKIIERELNEMLEIIPYSSFKLYCDKVYRQFIQILKHKKYRNHQKVEFLDFMFKTLGHMDNTDEHLTNEKGLNYGKY